MAQVERLNFVTGTQIASSATEYVTATNAVVAIDKVLVYNADASPIDVTFYVETSGGTPAAADIIVKETVPAGEHMDIADMANVTLNSGQALFVAAGTAGQVGLYVGGRQIT